MNPVLVFLILAGAFILWLVCSSLYKPIGKFFNNLWNKANKEMFEDKEDCENEKDKA